MDVECGRDRTDESGDKRSKESVAEAVCTGMATPSLTDTPTAPGEVATPVLLTGDNVVRANSIGDTP